MPWVSYEYYADAYLGDKLSTEEFYRAEKRAETYADTITMGRVQDYLDESRVKDFLCAAAECYGMDAGIGDASSISNDGLSITLDTSKTLEQELLGAAELYLAPLGLLYRGIG